MAGPDSLRSTWTPAIHRFDRLRRLAWAAALLLLVVTTASAWLRLAQPRPECTDWPTCRSVDRPTLRTSAPAMLGSPGVMAVVRGTHRAAASLVLLLAIALVVLTRRQAERAATGPAIGLLLLALGLSVLGIVTPGSRSVAVLLGNLLGGLLMFALAWSLACRLDGAPALGLRLGRGARIGAALWAAQAALGAASGSGLGTAVSVGHLVLALAALPWAFAVGWAARSQGRVAEARVLMALAALQALLGGGAVAFGAPPAVVLLHNVGAALGLALLLEFGRASGPTQT